MGFWRDFLPTGLNSGGGGSDGIFQFTDHHEYNPHFPTTLTTTTTTTKSTIGTTPKSNKQSVPPGGVNCAEISPHFRHTYTSPEELETYLSALESCPLGSHLRPAITLPNNWIIDKQIYYTMVDRFYSEFYRSLPGTGNIDWVVTLNSYVNIQSLLLANNYMESNRVMNALLQCGSQLIPHSFVKPEMLRSALFANKAKVQNAHFEYLWDSDTDFQTYYKLPLADCTFTQDYKLLVRILVPVKIPDVETKLLQVQTFPFMEKLNFHPKNGLGVGTISPQLCKLEAPTTIRMIQSSFGLLFENRDNCEPHQLCSRSSLNSFLPLDGCISAILSGNETLVKGGCNLSCFPVDARSLPIFQKSSSDTFLALGTSDNKIFIQCNGQPLEKLGLVDLGCLEIKLSCNCQISYRNLVLQPSVPCSREVMPKVRRLLPLHWENILDISKDGGIFNEDVILTRMATEKEKYYHYDVMDHHHGTGIASGTGGGDYQNADKQISMIPTSESSVGLVIQMCMIWIIILALMGLNAFLAYKVHCLIQWKKIQVYKDTRIVYSVPPSPQFPNKF